MKFRRNILVSKDFTHVVRVLDMPVVSFLQPWTANDVPKPGKSSNLIKMCFNNKHFYQDKNVVLIHFYPDKSVSLQQIFHQITNLNKSCS